MTMPVDPLTPDASINPDGAAPDRSLEGQPLFLFINDGSLDSSVEKAAAVARDQLRVPIVAVRFPVDPSIKPLADKWLNQQRRALAAWRAQEHVSDSSGRLSLRSRTATDNRTGTDWLWASVIWIPVKNKGVTP